MLYTTGPVLSEMLNNIGLNLCRLRCLCERAGLSGTGSAGRRDQAISSGRRGQGSRVKPREIWVFIAAKGARGDCQSRSRTSPPVSRACPQQSFQLHLLASPFHPARPQPVTMTSHDRAGLIARGHRVTLAMESHHRGMVEEVVGASALSEGRVELVGLKGTSRTCSAVTRGSTPCGTGSPGCWCAWSR